MKGRRAGPSLTRRLVSLLAATALLLVVIVVVGAISLTSLRDAEGELVGELQVARIAVKELEVALVGQEAGVQAFVIADDDQLLEPTVAGVETEAAALATIAEAMADDDAILEALAAVEEATAAWRDDVVVPVVTAVGDGRPEEAEALLEAGTPSFDAVQIAVADLDGMLRDRRAAGVARFDDATTQLVIVGAAGAALLVAMAVLVTLALRRSVLGPLHRLGDDAAQVAAGDFEHEIAVTGPAEIRQLALAMEEMRRRVTQEFFQVLAARAELAAKAEELERSNRDLEQFAYVASHDLQEPLRKVSGFCQLLQRRYAGTLDERADQYIHYAVDGAQRMQDLISDLLSFSRVGRTTARFELVGLGEVVDTVWTHLDKPDDAHLDIDGELPVVAGDAALLRALFTNLFGNSVKFAGDAPPRVRVSATRVGEDRWEIVVADEGIGIDPEFAERVFVIFQRLHAREAFEGTGIGLALCKRIAEFHGGGIRLDGADVGTRFVVTLPVVHDPDAVGPPPEPLIGYRPEGVLK